jgi:uncharacterized protein (DUF1499 family)
MAGGHMPENLGVTDGQLAPCPPKPNCVCSQADDEEHRIAPFACEGDVTKSLARVEQIVKSMRRSTIVERSSLYLHVEFRSRLFRFVDDVEFLADPAAGVIHVRSASRTGFSDMGVNRARVGEIAKQFQREDGRSPD